MEKKLNLRLTLRVYTADQQRCFGPGIATLLEQIQEHHSLRAAAASMKMAYSKAWRIIKTAEEAFGFKLLSSTTGGRHGGGAALTVEAEQLLAAYRSYQEDVSRYASDRFEEAFRSFQP